MERLITATTLLALATAVAPVSAQSLRGSKASVELQHQVAVEHDYSFLASSSQVKRFASNGLLVSVPGNANYELAGVSYPFARPAVKTFVERLSGQYRSACGEPLVVTSLTRPTTRQPRNASDQSVHPAGMAVDLRISRTTRCRTWLERVLLELERKGVVEATRERYPAHYHVAVFPNPYLHYVGLLNSPNRAVATRLVEPQPEPDASAPEVEAPAPERNPDPIPAGDVEAASEDKDVADVASAPPVEAAAPHAAPADPEATAAPRTSVYRVSRGDTLWGIARVHGTSVSELKALNGLRDSAIRPGQRIKVPGRSE